MTNSKVESPIVGIQKKPGWMSSSAQTQDELLKPEVIQTVITAAP